MSRARHIALIESNLTGTDAILQMKEAGFRVTLFTESLARLKSILPIESLPAFDALDHVIETASTSHLESVSQAVLAHHARDPIDLLYTFAQPRIAIAARLAQLIGLPTCNPEAVRVASDKPLMREILNGRGISAVRFAVATQESELESAVRAVGFPCLAKPRFGHSSIGVRVLRAIEDLSRFAVLAKRDGVSDEILVEELLEGPLYSIEAITLGPAQHQIWGASDRILSGDSIEVGASFPISFEALDSAIDLVRTSLDAIGFDLGPSHTEIIVTSRGPRIVEINPRAGGSGISRLIEGACGQRVPLTIIQCLLGQAIPEFVPVHGIHSMCSVIPNQFGRILEAPSREEILAIDGVRDFWLQRRVGERHAPDSSNFSTLLTVLGRGSGLLTAPEVVQKASLLAGERIRIESDTA